MWHEQSPAAGLQLTEITRGKGEVVELHELIGLSLVLSGHEMRWKTEKKWLEMTTKEIFFLCWVMSG